MHHEKRSSSRLPLDARRAHTGDGSPVTACLGACSSKQTVSDFDALRESRPPAGCCFLLPFALESKPTY